MLNKLKEITKGDEKRMALYVETYIERMTESLSLLKEAVENEDYQEVESIAKEAKSLFEHMGFDELWKMANHVEKSVKKRGRHEIIQEHAAFLITDIQESLDLLEDL